MVKKVKRQSRGLARHPFALPRPPTSLLSPTWLRNEANSRGRLPPPVSTIAWRRPLRIYAGVEKMDAIMASSRAIMRRGVNAGTLNVMGGAAAWLFFGIFGWKCYK